MNIGLVLNGLEDITIFLNFCVWDGGLGVYGWMPLPTLPQRYCDPASLVVIPLDHTAASLKVLSDQSLDDGQTNRQTKFLK